MEYSSRADADLYLLFKSGDVQGFNTLFNRHWIGLFCVAKKILDDDELAKDAVQETFLSLYERDSAVDINHIRAYLCQSVKYQCFMQLRSGRISEKHLARLQTVMSFNNIEEEMDARELQTMLNFEIESLPEKCRQVFCLSRFEMLSNKKIAERLNISQKTVEHQITKALKTLRISLDKMAIFVWVLIS